MTTEENRRPAGNGTATKELDRLDNDHSSSAPHSATPVMYVVAVRYRQTGSQDYVWLLVGRCPLCLETHTHGGGNGAEPSYGDRGAHCRPAARRLIDATGYELRPAVTE